MIIKDSIPCRLLGGFVSEIPYGHVPAIVPLVNLLCMATVHYGQVLPLVPACGPSEKKREENGKRQLGGGVHPFLGLNNIVYYAIILHILHSYDTRFKELTASHIIILYKFFHHVLFHTIIRKLWLQGEPQEQRYANESEIWRDMELRLAGQPKIIAVILVNEQNSGEPIDMREANPRHPNCYLNLFKPTAILGQIVSYLRIVVCSYRPSFGCEKTQESPNRSGFWVGCFWGLKKIQTRRFEDIGRESLLHINKSVQRPATLFGLDS